jgi:isopentenyl-diphosphate Delta-isomerase
LILEDEMVIILATRVVSFTPFSMPRNSPRHSTSGRKEEHVLSVLTKDVAFRTKTTGLEEWEFAHNALPELDFSEIDLSTTFLGHTLTLPFMVSCMTGGYTEAMRINRNLAELCAAHGMAMGVGSQRQALESTRFHRSFSIVREVAPEIPIVGNIGAAEVAQMRTPAASQALIDLIRADALAVHLNPLQELLQPEGTPAFRGVLKGIAMLTRELPVPVIVKEIGAGISGDVARRLLEAGVKCIDVAGAGGTSWAGVEILRRNEPRGAALFWDWGIPTADALQEVASLKRGHPALRVIASGGLTTGLDSAKCFALGADLVASARPVLMALHKGGIRGAKKFIEAWSMELRAAMFLTGARTLADLQRTPLRRAGRP